MLNRIGIGTAQFGMAYGISNRHGQPTEREIDEMLALAWLAGASTIDTAAAYGDAERVIGRTVGGMGAFRIVTKTLPIADPVLTHAHGRQIAERFMRSLDNLREDRLHGLLLHQTDLLLRPGAEHITEALGTLRDQGLVSKIGASVYGAEELEAIDGRFHFELVQLPINIADQRLLHSGHLRRLKRRGVEIHARSVFLQGLLLMAPHNVPTGLAPVAAELDRFAEACRRLERAPIEACLQFALGIEEIDCLLVGANTTIELADILTACRSSTADGIDFGALAFADTGLLNPAQWTRST
jgi:aryl-alcohol dehydrogenase-like predicted oxidoreductase